MDRLHVLPIIQCLVLLTIANGVPVIAKKILGDWLAWPIDGGRLFWDGRPFLGKSKTFRGAVLATTTSTIGGLVVGLGLGIGMLVGFTAMAGDMLSSFGRHRCWPVEFAVGRGK